MIECDTMNIYKKLSDFKYFNDCDIFLVIETIQIQDDFFKLQ